MDRHRDLSYWLGVDLFSLERRGAWRPYSPATQPDHRDRYGLAEEAAGFGLWELEIAEGSALMSAGAALLWGLPPVESRVKLSRLTQIIHPPPGLSAPCHAICRVGKFDFRSSDFLPTCDGMTGADGRERSEG